MIKKNRKIVTNLKKIVDTINKLPDSATAWTTFKGVDRPGEYFGCYLHLTKDGENFGASNRPFYFKSPHERALHIKKSLKAMKRRQEKSLET